MTSTSSALYLADLSVSAEESEDDDEELLPDPLLLLLLEDPELDSDVLLRVTDALTADFETSWMVLDDIDF